MRRPSRPPALALALLIAGTLGVGGAVAVSSAGESRAQPARPSSALVPTVKPVLIPTTPVPVASPPPVGARLPITQTVAPSPRAPERRTYSTRWRAFATVGEVTLRYPVDVVELVGLHESSHDGAQQQQPVRGAGRIGLLDSRERGTRAQGAADIVVHPARAVRAPVSGRVLRAGSYTLYCDYRDHFLVIEPDNRPGWEVKLLHFEGLAVAKGDRVRAGVTVVGSHARVLPFASQVDKHTSLPHWPHLHVEVVDPTIADRPSKPCD